MLAQNLWNVNQILPSLALKSSYPKCTSSSHIPGSAIRSRRHGRYRQPSSEIEMRSVRLICQTEHPGIMRHFYDGPQIATDSIIGRIVDQYRYRLRMLCDCLCHLLSLHSQRNSQPLVHLRIYIDRNRSAQYQGIFNTLRWTLRGRMISSPPFAGSQHHTLYRAGSASHHKKSMCRSKCICCQFFRFPDDGYRVAQIVQRLHAVDIHAHTLFPQEFCQFRIAPKFSSASWIGALR